MLSPSSSLVRKEFKGEKQSPKSRAVAQKCSFVRNECPWPLLLWGVRSESLLPAQGPATPSKGSLRYGRRVCPASHAWALSSVFPEELLFPGLATTALAAVGPALRTNLIPDIPVPPTSRDTGCLWGPRAPVLTDGILETPLGLPSHSPALSSTLPVLLPLPSLCPFFPHSQGHCFCCPCHQEDCQCFLLVSVP